jgi:hypothetical protein
MIAKPVVLRVWAPLVHNLAAVLVLSLPYATWAAGLERFNGRMTRPHLEYYLSRAITMEGLLAEHGNLDDEIRLLKQTGARFAGRVLYLWGGERNLEAALKAARARERKVHAAMPDLMLQAAVFEIVSQDVETQPVPPRVFAEFRLPVEKRSFSYDAMLFPKGKYHNHWGKGKSVPDITRPETQMWFYYLATRYIDLGIEAIHFGQVDLMGAGDRDHAAWDGLLTRVRSYARTHARRGIVLCDAHVPHGGIVVGERLLLDFHSFPLRIDEDTEHPPQGVLRMGYLDSLYGRSKGGTTPSGWTCEHLPYLVELDNFGRSRREGKNIGGCWIWGYDEISWFAHLKREQRDQWLRYASRWIGEHDPNGHLEMPGSRTLAVPVNGADWYWASDPGPLCPTGFGDESTIRELWQNDSKNDLQQRTQ